MSCYIISTLNLSEPRSQGRYARSWDWETHLTATEIVDLEKSINKKNEKKEEYQNTVLVPECFRFDLTDTV